jgi:hypothetical protein
MQGSGGGESPKNKMKKLMRGVTGDNGGEVRIWGTRRRGKTLRRVREIPCYLWLCMIPLREPF